jgi:hypothetical protein
MEVKLPDNAVVLIPAFAFVGDVDLIQEPINDNTNIIQGIVDEWEDALSSSGGQLVADKCRFFIVKHVWENNR